jgi:hypothetical protein
MKFVLFVEGRTERVFQPFFKRYLDPRLAKPVGIKIVRFAGWSDYTKEIKKKVDLNLSGLAGKEVVAGIGILDLYGPGFYPKEKQTVKDRYHWAKEHLEDEVDNPRFYQHFAVHETEAWILADPMILPPAVKKALPGRSARPETVNFDEPPAKLLHQLYREKLKRKYKKTTDGAVLFEKLSPDTAGSKCPYLQKLLDQMLELAKEAEQGSG